MEDHSQKGSRLIRFLSPDLNRVPPNIERIHLMGICGTGMASLAGMLKHRGYQVQGSDLNMYPPMSEFLEELCVPVLRGYDAGHLHPPPDLVVVGNVITRENPEAIELARLRIPYVSFPQALNHFALKGRKSIVITGTHGKTTTSALVAWILEKAGLDPSFMIGGIPLNFHVGFKMGRGPYFVVEGDEYDTAFFDKGPKFLHYHPWMVILTSIEYDHADIYRDLEHVLQSFRELLQLIPQDGFLIYNADDPRVRNEISRAACPMSAYSLSSATDWRADRISFNEKGTHLRLLDSGNPFLDAWTPLYGRHNLSNLLAAVASAHFLQVPEQIIAHALRSFRGVKRRQEVIGQRRGILVLDDFAHHPTAVKETISAVKQRYSTKRLIAVFEPRSNSSRRRVFQDRYPASFENADLVFIPEPPMMERIHPSERFSSAQLVKDLRKAGINALYFPDTKLLLENLLSEVHHGDVILFMSNGAFDNLPRRTLRQL